MPNLVDALLPTYPTIRIIHRLDYATSGVMVFAKTKQTQTSVSEQFAKRTVCKRYVAAVAHTECTDKSHVNFAMCHSGIIAQPLICDWPNRPKQKICYEHGKPATTHWELMHQTENRIYLALKPITGRSHQLRVHLKSIGHPIIGDRLYNETMANTVGPSRLLLHAEQLEFTCPDHNKTVRFTLPRSF